MDNTSHSEDRTKPPEGYSIDNDPEYGCWLGIEGEPFRSKDEAAAAAWAHHDAIARKAEVRALEWALGPLEVSLDVARRMRHDGTAELVGDHVDRIRTRLEELNDNA